MIYTTQQLHTDYAFFLEMLSLFEFPKIGGGLYRDDILLIVWKHSKVEIERKTKAIRKFFGREGLNNISRRISTLSSNREIFNRVAPYYNNALRFFHISV